MVTILIPLIGSPRARRSLYYDPDPMKHAHRGFTLIELMTALMVLGILLAMAVPSFRDMTRSNRIATTQNELLTALAFARSEAVRQSTNVSVCPASSPAATACVPVSTGTTAWHNNGWIVFTDAGTAGAVNTASGDAILQRFAAPQGDTRVNGSASFIRYTPTGMTTAVRSFDVYFNTCTGAKARHVDVSLVGLVAAAQGNCP
jgi:type IV fimbrial biogenesis protein FimT